MYILFDLGRTKLRLARTMDKKNIVDISVVRSPASLEEACDLIVAWAEKIGGKNIIEFVGGTTAAFDKTRGEHLAMLIKQKSGKSAVVGNDASMGGLGEAAYGAGRGQRVVQYMTISTGVGGTRIIDGKVEKSEAGFEPGNQIINYEKNQSLQDLISGKAVEQSFGKHPKEIRDQEFWKDLSKILAVGIYNSILHWMPDVVVLGGSMITGDPVIPIKETTEHLAEINRILPKVPPIKKATLGDYGGLYGALAFLNTL